MIRRQLWLKCGSFLRLEGELKTYYEEQVAKRLTQEAFEKLWPKKEPFRKENGNR